MYLLNGVRFSLLTLGDIQFQSQVRGGSLFIEVN